MKQNPYGPVAIVTGASSGIGREIAFLLAAQGLRVYGGCRRGALPPDVKLQDHIPQGIPGGGFFKLLQLDVTIDESAKAFVEQVLSQEGEIHILVNAAGNGLCGAVEDCTPQDGQAQMEVNYFGVLRMLNLVLPRMRAQKKGLVINIGSVGGIFSIPFQTLYSSSKAALAMLTEGLRLELAPYGVKAALIEPGDVKTGFTAARAYTVAAKENPAYQGALAHAVGRMERDEQNGMSPCQVARAVIKAVYQSNPPARKVVGGSYRAFVFLKRILPGWLVERLLALMYLKQ